MRSKSKYSKEIILYSIIVVLLIGFTLLNNFYWKIGKDESKKTENAEIQQLEINNVTYNVPYNEQYLD